MKAASIPNAQDERPGRLDIPAVQENGVSKDDLIFHEEGQAVLIERQADGLPRSIQGESDPGVGDLEKSVSDSG